MPLVRGPIPQNYAPRRGRGGARLPKRPNHMHRLSIRLLHLPAAYLRTAPRALCCLRYVHAEGSVGTVCASWRASCGGARAHARAARAGTDRRLGGGTDRPARPFAAPRRSLVHAFGRCCRPSWRRGHGCRSARSSFRERNSWKLCARLPGCWQALLRRRVGALHCEAAPGAYTSRPKFSTSFMWTACAAAIGRGRHRGEARALERAPRLPGRTPCGGLLLRRGTLSLGGAVAGAASSAWAHGLRFVAWAFRRRGGAGMGGWGLIALWQAAGGDAEGVRLLTSLFSSVFARKALK